MLGYIVFFFSIKYTLINISTKKLYFFKSEYWHRLLNMLELLVYYVSNYFPIGLIKDAPAGNTKC